MFGIASIAQKNVGELDARRRFLLKASRTR